MNANSAILLILAAGNACPAMAGSTVQFIDATVPSGVSFTHKLNGAMIPLPQANMTGGLAIADFNRDGWPDIFWISGGVDNDRLFINDGDGTFTDRASQWGVASKHGGNAAAAGDFDDDGWIDLYVTSFGTGSNGQGEIGKNRLYRNSGNGTFVEVAAIAGVTHTSYTFPSGFGASWGDYDLDGDLDLAVAAWFGPGNGNRLYRNDGDGTFTDVTGVAVVFPPNTWGFQTRFADMDNDGWPDLLYSADFKTSRYYRNKGDGTFADMTATNGTGKDQNGMGQCVADFNESGYLDWYVTSIFLDVQQPNSGEGNKLYLNQGSHQFVEASQLCGVDDGGWGWGTVAVDVDHDMRPDIIEINGRPNNAEHALEQEYLWINDGAGTFTEMALAAGLTYKAEGKGIGALDFDRDGRMDVAMTFNAGLSKLYRNASTGGNWIHLTFDSISNPRIAPDGYNARVEVDLGSRTLIREMDGGVSYLSSGEHSAHFGLGGATVIDQLRVKWPRGYVTVLNDVPVNQHMTIVAPALADLDASGIVGGGDLAMLLGHWGPLGTTSDRKADLDNDGVVGGSDIAILLGAWGTN